MKIAILLILMSLFICCKEEEGNSQIFNKEDKLIYYEYVNDIAIMKIYFMSSKNSMEIPLPKDIFIAGAHFSPNGEKILLKDRRSKEGIYIYNLTSDKFTIANLAPLSHEKESTYSFYDYINDSTAIFKGLYNLFVIDLKTSRLINQIAFTDSSWIHSFDIINDSLILLNYGPIDALFNNDLRLITYNIMDGGYSDYKYNTGFLYQYLKSTKQAYLIQNRQSVVLLNLLTDETVPLKFDGIDIEKIAFSQSKFIDDQRILLLLETNELKYDFFIYNFMDESLERLTNSETSKELLDIIIKE